MTTHQADDRWEKRCSKSSALLRYLLLVPGSMLNSYCKYCHRPESASSLCRFKQFSTGSDLARGTRSDRFPDAHLSRVRHGRCVYPHDQTGFPAISDVLYTLSTPTSLNLTSSVTGSTLSHNLSSSPENPLTPLISDLSPWSLLSERFQALLVALQLSILQASPAIHVTRLSSTAVDRGDCATVPHRQYHCRHR